MSMEISSSVNSMSPDNKNALISMVDRIRSAMSRANITASDLTNKLDISSTSLTDWKKSNPSAYIIGRIANATNVSTDYLILGKENYDSLSSHDQAWLDLIHNLPEDAQNDFRGAMRLYIELHGAAETVQKDELREAK